MNKTLEDIKSAITSASSALRTTPDATLDKAFSATKSSHDAVFVYDEDNTFLGLVAPAYVLFKKRYDFNTQVKSCLFGPPHIIMATPLSQVAESMVSTGVYTLPVFDDNGGILGVMSAHKMLRAIQKDEAFFSRVMEDLKIDTAFTAPADATLHDVDTAFREKKVSRLVLVGSSGQLEGIVSRRDIQDPLVKPTARQRHQTGGKGPARNYIFGVEKEPRMDNHTQVLEGYAQGRGAVVTTSHETTKGDAVNEMLSSKKNSIVLIDQRDHPTGIISIRSVLHALAQFRPEPVIPISVEGIGLTNNAVQSVMDMLMPFAKKMNKRSPVEKVLVTGGENKNASGQISTFEITLRVFFYTGETLVATSENRDLRDGLRDAMKRIDKQERRKG